MPAYLPTCLTAGWQSVWQCNLQQAGMHASARRLAGGMPVAQPLVHTVHSSQPLLLLAACLPACPCPSHHHCHCHCHRYELHSEFEEALDHAQDRGRNTKILLKVSDVGVQY